MLERLTGSVDYWNMCRASLMVHCKRLAVQATFNSWSIVAINDATVSNFIVSHKEVGMTWHYWLAATNLLPKLFAFMPDDGTGIVYSLFGETAYPNSAYSFGGFRNPADGSDEASLVGWKCAHCQVLHCWSILFQLSHLLLLQSNHELFWSLQHSFYCK